MFWENDLTGLDKNTFIINQDETYTFERIFSLADAIYENIPSRSIVLIEAERDLSTVISYIGALRKRIVPLLIDANSAAANLKKFIKDFEIDFIFSIKEDLIENYKKIRNFKDRFIFQRLDQSDVIPHEQLGLLMPTSGSTGETKCVRTSYINLNEVTYSIMRYMKMDASRVSISSLQFYYTYGLSVLNLAIASRSKLVLTNYSWIERAFWSLVELHKVSDLSGVPFMFQTLKRIKLNEKILKNLKCVNQAGGHLEPSFTEYFIDYFTPYHINYLTMYGATEASPRMSYVPSNRSKEKLGTVGIPIDIGVLNTDAKDGRSEGEIIYSGANVCMGYALSRKDLGKGDENRGILKTGDFGFIDKDGFLTIVGRTKRFVKIFGISVNLDSLEVMLKSIAPESVIIGEDDNIVVLYRGEIPPSQIKEKIMSQVTFSNKALKIVAIPEIILNSSGKPDYPRMKREFL